MVGKIYKTYFLQFSFTKTKLKNKLHVLICSFKEVKIFISQRVRNDMLTEEEMFFFYQSGWRWVDQKNVLKCSNNFGEERFFSTG